MLRNGKASKGTATRRVLAGTAAVAALMFGAPGTASAADFSAVVDMQCVGLSPNIVDVPYSGRVYVGQYSGRPGWTSLSVHTGASIWGNYTTHPTLTWTNLATGVSGTASGSVPVSSMFGTGGQVAFDAWDLGPGPVRFDLSVVNSGLVPVPAVNCSGVLDIPA
ncbi:hypothetical protein [Nocardia paucivorans]|uniref:hypothetical protein n=1 Tax=Nocardia paucivorans TaxID=114259 RepID=UPI0006876D13|nr:hypothetical protein [Nocardia paucivorans]